MLLRLPCATTRRYRLSWPEPGVTLLASSTFQAVIFPAPTVCAQISPFTAAAKKAKAGAALVEVIDIPLMGSERPDTLMRVAMILMAGSVLFRRGEWHVLTPQ